MKLIKVMEKKRIEKFSFRKETAGSLTSGELKNLKGGIQPRSENSHILFVVWQMVAF